MKIKELMRRPGQRNAWPSRLCGVLRNSLDLTGGFIIVEAKLPDWLIGRRSRRPGCGKNYRINLMTVRKVSTPEEREFACESAHELIGVPLADYRFEAEEILIQLGDGIVSRINEWRLHTFNPTGRASSHCSHQLRARR